jgi:PAS domain S-box-containing protein
MTATEPRPDHVLQIGVGSDVPLEEAFADSYALFNETTRRYMEAYKQLEEQFEFLNVRLEETNRDLRDSLEEKDRVSNYLNNILESMTDGLLVVGLDGRINLFNQAAEAITGRSQEEVLGRPYEEVMGLEGGREKSVLHTLESGDSLVNQQKDLRRTDERTIPLGFSTSLVRDGNGVVLGAIEAFNDMTEVRRLENQVRQMHTLAALGEMAATVAHEIRNPLGGIASFANLLERDLEADDPNRRLVRKITEGVARLNRIVSSLLSYTRPLNLNTHPVDLSQTVEEAAAFFEIDAARQSPAVTIERHFAESRTCQVDTEQFHQVVLNLLLNARQAMPEGGTIGIELSSERAEDGDWAIVCVRDSGIGIEAAVRDKLFTPFFTTKEDGTGLGLVTSRKIVEAHGGRITVDSVPGQGTCFTIALPM